MKHFKYMKLDIIYPVVVIVTYFFITFCRKFIISDSKLNKTSFEFASYAFFMTNIFEIALLLLGSWNCLKDRTMKVLWFVFTMVFVTLWSVFRQHRMRIKFDSKMKNIPELPTETCDYDC